MNSVGSWTRISYALAFLVAQLAALYIFRCVGPVALLDGVSSLSVDMFGGGGGGGGGC